VSDILLSYVLRRGVLGDRVEGRSREGRFLSQIERELTRQVGKPSFTQKLLIRRLSRAMLRLELLDEKATAGTLTRLMTYSPTRITAGQFRDRRGAVPGQWVRTALVRAGAACRSGLRVPDKEVGTWR